MKKPILLLATLFVMSVVLSSCSDDENANLTGYWKCTGVGANLLGTSTNSFGGEYLKYFSIGFVGTKTSGAFVRVGTDDLSALASLTNLSFESLKKLLSAGTYTCNAADGTITLKSNGESTIYDYKISGNSLKLVEASEASSGTVDNVLNVINSLFDLDVDKTVGIEYSYERLNGLDAFNKLFKSKD